MKTAPTKNKVYYNENDGNARQRSFLNYQNIFLSPRVLTFYSLGSLYAKKSKVNLLSEQRDENSIDFFLLP